MNDYGEDLAYIHDAGFSGFALNAARGLMAHLRRNGIDSGRVVELGCGNGILARQLGFAGYDVVGLDASAAMIRLARKNAPKAKLAVASLAATRIPECDAVVSIGECVSYAFANDRANRGIRRLFGRVRRALREGGVFVFDFARPGRAPGALPGKGYWEGDDWVVLVERTADASAGVLTRRITTFRRLARNWRRSDETHLLRAYRVEELSDLLAGAGFDVKALRGYGDVRFRPGDAGLLARRKRSPPL